MPTAIFNFSDISVSLWLNSNVFFGSCKAPTGQDSANGRPVFDQILSINQSHTHHIHRKSDAQTWMFACLGVGFSFYMGCMALIDRKNLIEDWSTILRILSRRSLSWPE